MRNDNEANTFAFLRVGGCAHPRQIHMSVYCIEYERVRRCLHCVCASAFNVCDSRSEAIKHQ